MERLLERIERWPSWVRFLVVLSLFGAYALSFQPLFRMTGAAVGAFGVFPALVAGALLGPRYGAAMALLIIPINGFLHPMEGSTVRGALPTGIAIALFAAVVGYLRNVTLALRAEKRARDRSIARVRKARALRKEKEALLLLAQEVTKMGSWEVDLRTAKIVWSKGIYRIFGLNPERFQPSVESFFSHVHVADRPKLEKAFERALASDGHYSVMFRAVRPDGSIRHLDARGLVLRDADGTATKLIGGSRDITDQREIEGRLVAADRAASLGTLAGGVAHEINNPLSYVIANLNFLKGELRAPNASHSMPEWESFEEALEDASEGAERVRRIVCDLKTFSRADEETRGPVDLKQVLEFSVKMTRNEIRHRARLVEAIGELPSVDANEARLGQVFVNLLVNAAQAIPEGHADENQIRISGRIDARGWAVIEISDTGCGIPEETLHHIFEPFFTTKPIGIGTGLGLAICHGIVKSFGGALTVESHPGEGTTFAVSLRPAAAAPTLPPEDIETLASRGSILIVDDDRLVGSALRRALGNGHAIEVVTSAEEALRRMAAKRFDLVLCDLMMPEVTGMDLYERVLQEHRDRADNLVFMTGGAFTPRARAFASGTDVVVLDKPLDMKRVDALVCERTSSARSPAEVAQGPRRGLATTKSARSMA